MKNKLIIFTHGNLANELINAVRLILGEIPEPDIYLLSNKGLSLENSISVLTDIVDNEYDYIVLTDFPGGSCFIASKKVSMQYDNVFTITGVNISMVISFITKKDKYKISQLAEVVKIDGNRAIR